MNEKYLLYKQKQRSPKKKTAFCNFYQNSLKKKAFLDDISKGHSMEKTKEIESKSSLKNLEEIKDFDFLLPKELPTDVESISSSDLSVMCNLIDSDIESVGLFFFACFCI